MKQTADLLVEIGCEEIPAGMIEKACAELKAILDKYLGSANLMNAAPLEVFGAPRRLAILCKSLRLRQPDLERELTGPPKSVAYDLAGRPTKAAEAFASKSGVPLSQVYVVKTARGEYLAAKTVTSGRNAKDLLPDLLARAITEIPWPRTMYWTGKGGMRFIRPIRWIVALLGGSVVPVSLAGLNAGSASSGHRFLGKKSVPVRGTMNYEAELKKNFVIARPDLRRKKIESEVEKLSARRGLRVHADASLMSAVTYLNEYPTVVLGNFDSAYLDLPGEILITVMRDHQKYFALETRTGRLAPHFLAVINLDRDAKGLVQAGHERVLRARFADAQFFWDSDQKCRLADVLPKLNAVMYESRLGSYGDKVARMRDLARWFAEQWFASGLSQASAASADRAAELAKCDLVTGMVGEFPELQGIVGGLYAEAQGEPEEISRAVYEHYQPAGADESIPSNLTGCAVSLADKLDALAGCAAFGLMPTGSSDPFGLRRAALGVVRIILERRLPVPLSMAIGAATKALSSNAPHIKLKHEAGRQALEFVVDRARFLFREKMGFAYDEVNAALAAGSDDLVDAHRRLEAIKATRRTKNFEPLAVSFKRIRKIVDKAGDPAGWRAASVREDLFDQPAERALHEAAQAAANKAGVERRAGRYREALQVISELRPAVDRFFDDVLVMAEDDAVRKNRLTMLAQLLTEFSTVADFSEIVTESR